jgi:hypothetical protein
LGTIKPKGIQSSPHDENLSSDLNNIGLLNIENRVKHKTAFGPRGQDEISLKIDDLSSNKTTGKLS